MEKKRNCIANLVLVGAISLGAYGGAIYSNNSVEEMFKNADLRYTMNIYNKKLAAAEKELDGYNQADLNKKLGINKNISMKETKKSYSQTLAPSLMEEARIEAGPQVEKDKEILSKSMMKIGGGLGAMAGGAFGVFARGLIRKKEEDEYMF